MNEIDDLKNELMQMDAEFDRFLANIKYSRIYSIRELLMEKATFLNKLLQKPFSNKKLLPILLLGIISVMKINKSGFVVTVY